MFQPKAPKCSKYCSLPQKFGFFTSTKTSKASQQNLIQGPGANPTLQKMPNKEFHKETIIDQCKNKMHEDKRSISFEEEDKSVVV